MNLKVCINVGPKHQVDPTRQSIWYSLRHIRTIAEVERSHCEFIALYLNLSWAQVQNEDPVGPQLLTQGQVLVQFVFVKSLVLSGSLYVWDQS